MFQLFTAFSFLWIHQINMFELKTQITMCDRNQIHFYSVGVLVRAISTPHVSCYIGSS